MSFFHLFLLSVDFISLSRCFLFISSPSCSTTWFHFLPCFLPSVSSLFVFSYLLIPIRCLYLLVLLLSFLFTCFYTFYFLLYLASSYSLTSFACLLVFCLLRHPPVQLPVSIFLLFLPFVLSFIFFTCLFLLVNFISFSFCFLFSLLFILLFISLYTFFTLLPLIR